MREKCEKTFTAINSFVFYSFKMAIYDPGICNLCPRFLYKLCSFKHQLGRLIKLTIEEFKSFKQGHLIFVSYR